MNYICEICGEPFVVVMTHIDDELWDVPYPNRVRVEIAYPGSLAIRSFKACQKCAGEVVSFINRRKREFNEKGK